ncbi:MAG: recombinase family protein [Ruminococcus sp.]|nr:recombinase family protein [Ruminococcus sp.]
MPTVTVIQPIITEKQNTKIRCAAYCRVSSDSEDQLNSFMAQTKYYEKAFENSETEQLVDIYADEGITGTREDKRNEFQRMMKDCRKGKIDRIYTKSISRFARNTKDCLKNVRELKSLGITILFEKEQIDTANMTDEMMITIMGGLAQEESTSISNNIKWSYQKRFEKGTVNVFSAPFGYKLSNGTLIINEDQAKIIRTIFEMFLSGIGYQRISEICKKQYFQYKETFSYYGILYILSNEKYIGDSVYQKTFTTNSLPYKKLQNNGQLNKYYIQNTHEAIISTEIFERTQNLIKSRKHNNIKSESIFKGRIMCANCGSKYKRKICRNKVFWVCRKHDNSAESCMSKRIEEKFIKQSFIRLYNKLWHNYRHILIPLQTSLQELKIRRFNGNSNVMDIHKEIAKLKEQTHVLARLKTKGFLDNAKYLEQTTELTAKINKLQSELKKLTRSDDEDEALEQIEILIDFFEKRENSMAEFDESAFEFLVEKIVVINQNELGFHIIGGLKFKELI